MDILSLMRMLGALGVVLGLLVGALWAVRRFQIKLPGVAGGGGPGRRLELVERVSMDPRRSVALIRRDGREHLLLLAPEGNMVIETGIQQDDADREAARIRAEQAEAAAAAAFEAAERSRAEFKAMMDRTAERLDDMRRGAGERIAGRLGDVREGAIKAARKARDAAERRRQGRTESGEIEIPAEAEAAAETPADTLFAGLVDEANAAPAKPRRRQPRKPTSKI